MTKPRSPSLEAALPRLLPLAIAWAEALAREVVESGTPLDGPGLVLARAVGVREPEQVRLARVAALPVPEHPGLRAAALETGLAGPGMVGLTLGHSVLLCRGHESECLLAHELRHVHQYEAAGSIAAFLAEYLRQIVEVGYANAPFEIDARTYESANGRIP